MIERTAGMTAVFFPQRGQKRETSSGTMRSRAYAALSPSTIFFRSRITSSFEYIR